MEEEDLPFQTPFFLQTANNTNPKQQKQPKPQTSKCNCNPSSSITQQIKSCKGHQHPQLNNTTMDLQKDSTKIK